MRRKHTIVSKYYELCKKERVTPWYHFRKRWSLRGAILFAEFVLHRWKI
jgi:hypothetical protein